MKLTHSFIAKDSDGEVRVTFSTKANGKWNSQRIRERHERITNRLHEALATFFNVSAIKIK